MIRTAEKPSPKDRLAPDPRRYERRGSRMVSGSSCLSLKADLVLTLKQFIAIKLTLSLGIFIPVELP